jgi:hypothetical protein
MDNMSMVIEIDYDWYQKNLDKWFFNLDKAVINALRFYSQKGPLGIDLGSNKERVIGFGSGNAYHTVRVLLSDFDSVSLNESNFEQQWNVIKDKIKKGVLVSASGGKDAHVIAEFAKRKGFELKLMTCTRDSKASEFISKGKVYIFPKLPEPYTYNTSTYLGMILGKTHENPAVILRHLEEKVDPILKQIDFSKQTGYYFLVPKEFQIASDMFEVKFQELFARKIARDFFTKEFAIKHATDIVDSGELFISIGEENQTFGRKRLHIPLPQNSGYGGIIATGYYLIGKIQKQQPPYFKEGIVKWCKERGIDPIVR